MADQILSSLVGKLLDYLAVPVGRQFSYLFQYNGNMEEFKRQLGELELTAGEVKLKVEAAERNPVVILPTVEAWLKRVDAVSDELKRFVGEEDAISNCCVNCPLNLKVRYQRSRKAKKQALEIMDAIKKAGSFDSVSLPAPPPPIGFMNNENEFDFESRRSVINEIMDAIKDDGVKMIGIWGMAGIGKTTLGKKVAKYAKDEGLFEVVAMAVVSQNPSVKDIQGQIADKIGLKFTCESEGGRADQLLQALLARKKILVILDDIWDSIELNDIGIPSGTQHKGCKIILTSRRLDVCEQMQTGKNFKIDLLSENEALDLFLTMSGVDNRSSQKGRLAEELSKECGGLLLAIVIVARGLRNKETNDWTDTWNRLRNSDLDSKVRIAIESSYNKVEREEEKKFFLLCALFPEDYEIPVRVLFEYGIGLNLFKNVNNVDEALVRAHKLASRLKSSCLLLDGGSDEGSDEKSDEYVNMHDVVRDAALAIASEGKNAFLVRPVAQWREWQDKTAISLWNDDIVKKLPDAIVCSRLEILILNCRNPKWQLPDNFFTGMKTLIVLDIEGMKCERLPQSFAGLENLQTLRLRYCELGDISTIGKLQKLVSLSFYGSIIEVLPIEVGELSNLRLLDLTSCERLEVITPGVIQSLSQLEVLLMRRFFYGDGELKDCENAVVSELIYLPRIMILEILIQDTSMLRDEVLFQKLTKFKISIGYPYHTWKEKCGWDSQILKLKCISENEFAKGEIKMLMKKAQHLELEDVSGIYVALPSLQQLRLINLPSLKEIWHRDHPATSVGELSLLKVERCGTLLEIFPSNLLAGVQNLKTLEVLSCASLEHVFAVKDHPPFLSNLKDLSLDNLPKLKQLWWNENTCENFGLPSLCDLTIDTCPALQFVFDPSVASRLENLKTLLVRNCSSIVEIVAEKPGKMIELEDFSGISVALPSLEKLSLINLPLLKEIWHGDHPATTVGELTLLTVKRCDRLLEIFPSNLLAGVQNLKSLDVQSCASLEHVFAIEDHHPPFLSNLEQLILYNLPKLKQLWWNQNPCENFGLPRLCELVIDTCPTLQFVFHPSVGSRLENLRDLVIRNCSSMVGIVAEITGKKIEFPLLGTLRLMNLPCFKVNRSVEFPHAKFVSLDNCFDMKKLYGVNVVERDGNIQLPGWMSFF